MITLIDPILGTLTSAFFLDFIIQLRSHDIPVWLFSVAKNVGVEMGVSV